MSKKMLLKKPRLFVFLSLLIIFSVVAVCVGYSFSRGNFHEITPGEAYRSAQLDRDQFGYYVKKYDIKSILNLRGSNPDQQWYKDEINVSRELSVVHCDLALGSTKEPSDEDIQKLVYFFNTAPRPVLIHCKAGADRSGLAAALWKVIVDKESKAVARDQLSILYGHLPLAGTEAMDRYFDKWQSTDQ